jgi:hypothetical protein
MRDAPVLTTMPTAPLSPFVAPQHRDSPLLLIADTARMIFRHRVLHFLTPDAPHGRATAAQPIFVQGGPQPGQLEAGAGAAGFGAPFSGISGGVACVLTVILIGWRMPGMRRRRIER